MLAALSSSDSWRGPQCQQCSKKELVFFQPSGRITFASIEQGVVALKAGIDGKKADQNSTTGGSQNDDLRVLSVRLYTNRGRRLIAQANQNDVKAPGEVEKDGVLYERVQTTHTDCLLSKGTLKGFFGRADETTSQAGGILRLGLV